MRAIGVVGHGPTALHRKLPETCLFPDVKSRTIIVVGIEHFLLAVKKTKGKSNYIVLDLPGHLTSIGLPIFGAKEVSAGRWVKTELRMPGNLPEFTLDHKLLATRLTIASAKALSKEAST